MKKAGYQKIRKRIFGANNKKMKSLRFPTSFSSDSFSQETEEFSSSSTQNVFKLQKEILAQSQSIEDYIKTHHSQLKSNESFSVLESLFTLFKSEVSMNLTLRKAILQERKIRANCEQEKSLVVSFFQELSRITNTPINSFEDVYSFVISKSDKFIQTKRNLQNHISQNQDQINKLEQVIQSREDELQIVDQNLKNADQVIEKLKTKLLATKTQVSSLKSELAQSNEIIQKQRLAIQEQKHANSSEQENAQNEIEEIKSECEQSLQVLHQKLHIQRQKSKSQSLRIKELEANLNNQEEIYESKISEMTEQIQKLTDANQNASTRIHSENKKIDYLTTQNSELEEQILQMKQKIENYETQLFTMKGQIDHMKSSNQAYRKKYEMKLHSVKLEHKHELNTVASNVEISLEKKMKTINEQLQQKEDEISMARSELETAHHQLAELVQKLRKQEKRRQKEQQDNEDFRIENERLRNMMRERSDNQKEVEYVLTEFQKLQGILNLGPKATPHDVVDKITSIISRRIHHRY
ncbi:hypothetical protein TRFO_42434 [Tritrichomonas foetus]|uniref:Uncharacterized protein n=1 Tax=Tritrichomonas foetus TaxID=1144522 RepID=A0A1J4L0W3_9EUKA|nr:hypothetical protein TRFO_42434 [Tritrichomonas foetus]|eukprot:OHT15606.1 hypothetical protein TRFO_42434 [Tritrichomonas foetus]